MLHEISDLVIKFLSVRTTIYLKSNVLDVLELVKGEIVSKDVVRFNSVIIFKAIQVFEGSLLVGKSFNFPSLSQQSKFNYYFSILLVNITRAFLLLGNLVLCSQNGIEDHIQQPNRPF